jgi:integrase
VKKLPYLRSKRRRGRWFHTYRRQGKEVALGVHGLHPSDPRVTAAWAAEHARWEHRPPDTPTPKAGTFAWAVDLLRASPQWAKLAGSTRQNREAILRRYVKWQGARPLSSITTADIEGALYAKGGNAAVNELKALRPVFAHAKRLRFIASDPTRGIELERPASRGFATAGAEDIEKFQKRWPIGTTERLIFDLAICTGAARADLVHLSRKDVADGILSFRRQKTGVLAQVPVTPELRAVIDLTPDIAPAFLLTSRGRPFTAAGLGNRFGEAARAAGIAARLHGLRKGFCVYWAERGVTTHQIAAMAGHTSLSEVERYTRAADRRRMVKLLIEGA